MKGWHRGDTEESEEEPRRGRISGDEACFILKDSVVQRTLGLIVQLHCLKSYPVAIFERRTCMFSHAEKGF